MKKLYHSLMAKYYGWRVKRFYKRLFNEMPLHPNLLVADDGALVCLLSKTELMVIIGSGSDNQDWPTLKGYRTDYELEVE